MLTFEDVEDGNEEAVTDRNKRRYVDLKLRRMVEDAMPAVRAVRAGLFQESPVSDLLQTLSAGDLQTLLRGRLYIAAEELVALLRFEGWGAVADESTEGVPGMLCALWDRDQSDTSLCGGFH